jgi:DNA-binding response OmpR family regulator
VQPFGPPRQPLSVLLVEQDELLRAAIGRLFEAAGHRIVQACAGRQAAAAIREEKFDLLVIDVLFPGDRTLEAVVGWSRTPDRGRILGLCRFSRILPDYYLLLTAKLGVRVILSKPFDGAQLTEAIDEVFADNQANWRDGACVVVA